MKIILTGGGTAGHVTPNIALMPHLKEKGLEIHYIGTNDGIERQLIEQVGIPYHAINAGKLRRYLDMKNITDTFRISQGFFQSLSIIRKVKPDVVFSKGGFVSCPVVWAARISKVPVVIHESDYSPGLANKLSIPFAAKVCYTFPETEKFLKGSKGILTGIPVRDELFTGNKDNGRKICGFTDDLPVLMVIGGSLGAGSINAAVRDGLEYLLKRYQLCHICGKGNMDEKLNNTKGYKQFEYVSEDLPHLFAMADVVISRAGATAIFELLSLNKPNLLIPLSRQASRGDQILNASSFEKQGFSRVLMDEELNAKTLLDNIDEVYKHRYDFVEKMSESKTRNGVESVTDIILEVCKK